MINFSKDHDDNCHTSKRINNFDDDEKNKFIISSLVFNSINLIIIFYSVSVDDDNKSIINKSITNKIRCGIKKNKKMSKIIILFLVLSIIFQFIYLFANFDIKKCINGITDTEKSKEELDKVKETPILFVIISLVFNILLLLFYIYFTYLTKKLFINESFLNFPTFLLLFFPLLLYFIVIILLSIQLYKLYNIELLEDEEILQNDQTTASTNINIYDHNDNILYEQYELTDDNVQDYCQNLYHKCCTYDQNKNQICSGDLGWNNNDACTPGDKNSQDRCNRCNYYNRVNQDRRDLNDRVNQDRRDLNDGVNSLINTYINRN